MINTDNRKSQLSKAKRRYEFKKMVTGKESKGIRYSITGDALTDIFMNQTDDSRLSGVVFLKGYRVADTVKATDLDTEKGIHTTYQGIPLETNQHELIELLARYFHARHIAPDNIRRTLNKIARYHSITLIPETTLGDLPDRIGEAVSVMTFIAEDVAKAILGGLRKAEYGDRNILTILDCIAAAVRNPPKK